MTTKRNQLMKKKTIAKTTTPRFQMTKTRQKLDKTICEIVWVKLMLATTWQFLKCIACIHRKRKLCKSAEIDFGKIRQIKQVNLFLAGFSHLKPLCISSGSLLLQWSDPDRSQWNGAIQGYRAGWRRMRYFLQTLKFIGFWNVQLGMQSCLSIFF
jgi:hypothetical protein